MRARIASSSRTAVPRDRRAASPRSERARRCRADGLGLARDRTEIEIERRRERRAQLSRQLDRLCFDQRAELDPSQSPASPRPRCAPRSRRPPRDAPSARSTSAGYRDGGRDRATARRCRHPPTASPRSSCTSGRRAASRYRTSRSAANAWLRCSCGSASERACRRRRVHRMHGAEHRKHADEQIGMTRQQRRDLDLGQSAEMLARAHRSRCRMLCTAPTRARSNDRRARAHLAR